MNKKTIFILSIVCLITNAIHTMQEDPTLSIIDEKSVYTARTVHQMILSHYHCPIDGCRYTHGRNTVIQNHIKLHNRYNNKDLPQKFYSCRICNFLTLKKQTFKRHEQSHSNKKYSCNQCPKKLKYKDSLRRHKKTQHPKSHTKK